MPIIKSGVQYSGKWTRAQQMQAIAAGTWKGIPTSEIYVWGSGGSGQLGLGTTTSYSSPVQVGSDITWDKITTGDAHVLSTRTDSTLWTWGYNGFGQLGLDDTTNRSLPTQVGALTNWYSIGRGSNHSIAIKSDGTIWATGYNVSGQLGQGNTLNRSSFVQIGALTNWAIAGNTTEDFSLAIKTDGTLWSWGRNDFGQLGLNNTTNRSSPTQVGALTTWAKVAGGGLSAAAIKTDGTLWTWGIGSVGSLGQGNTTS
jgi:alpha-tubulin suppressor-like RCC1 family protein